MKIIKAWNNRGIEIETAFASPYASIDNIKKEANKLKKDDINLIFMD